MVANRLPVAPLETDNKLPLELALAVANRLPVAPLETDNKLLFGLALTVANKRLRALLPTK
jgi:hypothetical protein